MALALASLSLSPPATEEKGEERKFFPVFFQISPFCLSLLSLLPLYVHTPPPFFLPLAILSQHKHESFLLLLLLLLILFLLSGENTWGRKGGRGAKVKQTFSLFLWQRQPHHPFHKYDILEAKLICLEILFDLSPFLTPPPPPSKNVSLGDVWIITTTTSDFPNNKVSFFQLIFLKFWNIFFVSNFGTPKAFFSSFPNLGIGGGFSLLLWYLHIFSGRHHRRHPSPPPPGQCQFGPVETRFTHSWKSKRRCILILLRSSTFFYHTRVAQTRYGRRRRRRRRRKKIHFLAHGERERERETEQQEVGAQQ